MERNATPSHDLAEVENAENATSQASESSKSPQNSWATYLWIWGSSILAWTKVYAACVCWTKHGPYPSSWTTTIVVTLVLIFDLLFYAKLCVQHKKWAAPTAICAVPILLNLWILGFYLIQINLHF